MHVRITRILEDIVSGEEEIKDLVSRSFLSDNLKTGYLTSLQKRRERILYSYSADKGKQS